MRVSDEQTTHLFSYRSPGSRVRPDHPLRAIRAMTDGALAEISPALEVLYATMGGPSIPPEQLLRALVLVHHACVTPADGYAERDAALITTRSR